MKRYWRNKRTWFFILIVPFFFLYFQCGARKEKPESSFQKKEINNQHKIPDKEAPYPQAPNQRLIDSIKQAKLEQRRQNENGGY